MSTGKIELSVGAVKHADKYEIFTEEEIDAINNKIPELDKRVGDIEDDIEEINNINNKIPELDERVGVIEGEIEEINSSLDNKANLNETTKNINSLQNRIDNLVIPISPENVNIEVTDAHNSTTKVTTFDSLKQRLDQFDYMQNHLIDDININSVTFNDGFLQDNYEYELSQIRKSTEIFNVSYGDIIYFSEKPSNIKWKISSFSSNTISSNTVVYRSVFSELENMNNYIINNENVKGCVITIGKTDDSIFSDEDITDLTSKIKIINIKKKEFISIGDVNELMFESKISKPSFKIAVYDDDYSLKYHDKRFASSPIYLKYGDKITFKNNGDFNWKLSTFSNSENLNKSTLLNGYTYADFNSVNEYIVDDEKCKAILIQGKHISDKVLDNNDLITFTESINIVSNKIKEELLGNNDTKPSYIRIGSYNIGHFSEGTSSTPSGTEEKKIYFRKCLASMNCNIIALQENDFYYNDTTKETPHVAIFGNFKYYSCGTKYDYNCNGFVSDYEIKNSHEKIFINNYNQTRYYYCCDITIDNKDVHLISTQLEFQDVDTRRKQIKEILEEVKKYERCIICGDFNVSNKINNVAYEPYNALYEEDYKLFTDQGLSIANVGYLGGINTLVGRDDSPDGIFPWDNIIVTNNIKIKNIGRVEMEYMKDHYPIFADLVIY